MRRSFEFATLVLLIAAFACAPPASRDSPELAARSDAWEAALNAGDVEALTAMYAEDCRILPPNGELGQGRAAAAAAFGEMIDAGLTGTLETVEARIAGDIGYRVGTYALQGPDGSQVDRGKFVEVWRQVDGDWRISNDIWNSDMPVDAESGTALIATHEVEDAARWLAAWQGEDGRRQQFARHGAPRVRVFQSPDNPNLTGLLIDVEDMEAFRAFLESPEGTAAKAEDGVKDATLRIVAEVR